MSGPCAAHPEAAATAVCHGCRRAFCDRCTIDFDGWTLCAPCKNRAVAWSMEVTDYRKPQTAFVLAMVGVFMMCFGIVLDIIAIVVAQKALREIQARPGLPGRALARWAILISSLGLLLHLLGFVAVWVR